uniref:SAP domain-containing protein n=1 Tax=Octopus bimaculoides TaxID=37653 RepID=A0A0L8HKV7_OCTBM
MNIKQLELKNYLRLHGQYVTGKEVDLVERLKGIKILSIKNVNELKSTDEKCTSDRNKQKLVSPLGEVLPDPNVLKSDWTNDLHNLPNFTENDVYNYLVVRMKLKRQLRSGIFYHDRHIHNIEYHDVIKNYSHCIVRSLVIPSIRTSNKKNTLDHRMSKVTGNVHLADCNCTAGKESV